MEMLVLFDLSIPFAEYMDLFGSDAIGFQFHLKRFNIEAKVALLSYSNFGSRDGDSAYKMREVYKKLKVIAPEMIVEGEMQGDLALSQELRERYVPDSVLRSPEAIVGRVPIEPILGLEPIRPERLADPEVGSGIQSQVGRGMRAIPVRMKVAVEGVVNLGSYVTLVGRDSQGACIVAETGRVIGLDPVEKGDSATVVWVEVTPAESTAPGPLHLWVRNAIDVEHGTGRPCEAIP